MDNEVAAPSYITAPRHIVPTRVIAEILDIGSRAPDCLEIKQKVKSPDKKREREISRTYYWLMVLVAATALPSSAITEMCDVPWFSGSCGSKLSPADL
ncbi:hypothetical protein INR49_015245 [Caranx melampygus]|nr:hypothetical protein INR49_015245 [Caranx melampygus]